MDSGPSKARWLARGNWEEMPHLNDFVVQFLNQIWLFAKPWTATGQASPSFTISWKTHVHWLSDAIQPSHPLFSPCSPAFSLSQHQKHSESHSVVSDSSRPHGLWNSPGQDTGLSGLSLLQGIFHTPGIQLELDSLPTELSGEPRVPTSWSFLMSQLFASGSQSTRASASA